MAKGFIPTLLLLALLTISSESALAQESVLVPVETDSSAASKISVPTNPILFALENAFFRIRTALTFQAERKAVLLQSRLDKLGLALERCQQEGNQECVDRIEIAIQLTQQRTERFLEQKSQLLENHHQRFQTWQQNRADRLKDRLQPEQRLRNQEQLIELRSEPLKNRLDQTTGQVDSRQRQLNENLNQ